MSEKKKSRFFEHSIFAQISVNHKEMLKTRIQIRFFRGIHILINWILSSALNFNQQRFLKNYKSSSL